MDCSTPGLPVPHQLPELSPLLSPTQTWARAFRVSAPACVPLQPHLSFLERVLSGWATVCSLHPRGPPYALSAWGTERERVCVCLLFQIPSPVQKPYLTKQTESQALLPSGAPALPASALWAPAGQSARPTGGVRGWFSLSSSAFRAAHVSVEEGSHQPGPCLPLGLFQFPHRNSMLYIEFVVLLGAQESATV